MLTWLMFWMNGSWQDAAVFGGTVTGSIARYASVSGAIAHRDSVTGSVGHTGTVVGEVS